MEKKLIYKVVFGDLLFWGSETGTVGTKEERVIGEFETWSWRGMLKRKWAERVMFNDTRQLTGR